MPRLQPEGPAGLHDPFPELVSAGAVLEVDLVAELARPAGAGDDEGDAVEFQFAVPVIAQIHNVLAEERAHDVPRLRALELQGRDVGLVDRHVHAGVNRDALRPEQDIAVGERQPEAVLGEAQEDRVVQHATLVVDDQNVFALSDGHLGKIARRQQLDEARGIRARDLDLAFNGHVAEDRVVHKCPEVGLWVPEIPRDIHVVVDREARCAPTQGGVEERGFPDLGPETEGTCRHHSYHPPRVPSAPTASRPAAGRLVGGRGGDQPRGLGAGQCTPAGLWR